MERYGDEEELHKKYYLLQEFSSYSLSRLSDIYKNKETIIECIIPSICGKVRLRGDVPSVMEECIRIKLMERLANMNHKTSATVIEAEIVKWNSELQRSIIK